MLSAVDEAIGPQMPEFVVRLSPAEVNHVSIPPQDAERLIQNLERGPHVSAAAKIRSATKLAAKARSLNSRSEKTRP